MTGLPRTEAHHDEKKNNSKSNRELPNVYTSVALVIQVATGGECDNEETVSHEELAGDPTQLESVIEAINESDEVLAARILLQNTAKIHKEIYPNTKCFLTPCLELKEPEEIKPEETDG